MKGEDTQGQLNTNISSFKKKKESLLFSSFMHFLLISYVFFLVSGKIDVDNKTSLQNLLNNRVEISKKYKS